MYGGKLAILTLFERDSPPLVLTSPAYAGLAAKFERELGLIPLSTTVGAGYTFIGRTCVNACGAVSAGTHCLHSSVLARPGPGWHIPLELIGPSLARRAENPLQMTRIRV